MEALCCDPMSWHFLNSLLLVIMTLPSNTLYELDKHSFPKGVGKEINCGETSSGVLNERIRYFNRLFQILLQNQKLLLENQLLREKTHGLVVENQELRQRLGIDALVTEEEEETKVSISFIWCPVRTGSK